MKSTVVFDSSPPSRIAYVPDLPDCVATVHFETQMQLRPLERDT